MPDWLSRTDLRWTGVVILWGLLAGSSLRAEDAVPSAEQLEFFESKVRPLLVEHCFECHSANAKKIKGGLKLDSREAAVQGGDSGAGLVPRDSSKSLIIDAVLWKSLEMPPQGKLKADQIEILTRWVDSGAAWPANEEQSAATEPATYNWSELRSQHWAWQPVQRPMTPSVIDAAWPTNEIDRFVLAGLEASSLSPAPAADPATLVRRVYFDLIGLPPPPEKIDEFVNAAARDRATALAALVDELLASPHYGERWARHCWTWPATAMGSAGFWMEQPCPKRGAIATG